MTNIDQILPLKCDVFLIGTREREREPDREGERQRERERERERESNARSSNSWPGWFIWNQLPRGGLIAL